MKNEHANFLLVRIPKLVLSSTILDVLQITC